MGYILSEGNKTRLKQNIIQGAQNYEQYLVGKTFQVICDDGTQTSIKFFQDDFKHMSGIKSDLNKSDFYDRCLDGKINTGNIIDDQKYNWATLRTKTNRLSKLHELIYKDGEKKLLLNELETNTYVFPVAIRNDDVDSCVGFVSDVNKARSLRKASTSQNSKDCKNIIGIFGKQNSSDKFDEIVYVKDRMRLLDVCPEILKDVSEDIKMKFDNIEE